MSGYLIKTPYRTLLLSALFLLILNSCNIINPDEQVPAYLYIEKFELSTDTESEGFASQNITDGWVFVNDQPVGTFELPALVPVLASGPATVTIIPGIKDNGMSGFRATYLAYDEHTQDLELSPNITDTIMPKTEYLDNVDFPLLERFESGNEFAATSNSDTSVQILTDPALVFEGNRSAALFVDTNNPFAEVRSERYELPENGSPVYLEIDYRSDVPINIDVKGYFGSGSIRLYILSLATQEDWTKIYINLTEAIGLIQAIDYEIIFNTGLPTDASEAYFYFDNVKIVHL